jgi:hypothetical protein
MPADSAKDRALLVIQAAHAQLSTFAQASYGMYGRGITLVSVPAFPPPGRTAQVETEMVYHQLTEVRPTTANMAVRGGGDVHRCGFPRPQSSTAGGEP